MATTPYPLPRSARRTPELAGNGGASYGPFGSGWGIFDTADVAVWRKDAGAAAFTRDPMVVVAKTNPAAAYSTFSITFAQPVPSGTRFYAEGRRVQERQLAVTRGGTIDSLALERELSKQAVVDQEVRRDVDGLAGALGDAMEQLRRELAALGLAIDSIQDLLAGIAGGRSLPRKPVLVFWGQSNNAANERADTGDKTPDARVKVFNPLTGAFEVMVPGVYPCREAAAPNSAPNPMAFQAAKLYAQITGDEVFVVFSWLPATAINTWTYVPQNGLNAFTNNWDKTTPETTTVKSVTAVAAVNPARLTVTGHGYSGGDVLAAESMPAGYGLSGRRFLIDVVDADNFTLRGVDGTGFSAYPGGGTVARAKFKGEATIERALLALGRTSVDFIVASQGESDSTAGQKYYLDMISARMTADRAKPWCRADTRHIAVEMSRRADYDDVNAALNQIYRSNLFPTFDLVPTHGAATTRDDYPQFGDDTHFAGTGAVLLGARIIAAMLLPRAYLGTSNDKGVVFIPVTGSEAVPWQADASASEQVTANIINNSVVYVNLDPRDARRGTILPVHNYSPSSPMRVTADANIVKTIPLTGRTAANPGLLHFDPNGGYEIRNNQVLLFAGTGIGGVDGNTYQVAELDQVAGTFALRVNPVTLLNGSGWGALSGGATATILPRTMQDPRTGKTDVDHVWLMPGEHIELISLGANRATRNLVTRSARLNPQHSPGVDRHDPSNMLWNGDFRAMGSDWKLNQWAQAQITPGFLVGGVGSGPAPWERSIYHDGFTDRDGLNASEYALDFYPLTGVPLAEGERVSFSCLYRTENSAVMSACRARVEYLDASGAVLLDEIIGDDVTAYTSWTPRLFASLAPAPAGTVMARPRMRVSKSAGRLRFARFRGARDGASYSDITARPLDAIPIAVGDETTPVTPGVAKKTFRMPYAFTLTAIRASLVTAQASGTIFTVDVNEAGASILSTKLTIDNTEKSSTTAATPAVLSDTALADDAEITIDVDQVGNGTAAGLSLWLIGRRA